MEKDGAFDPIGSELSSGEISLFFIDSSYLNTGIGNAWAWHKSAKS